MILRLFTLIALSFPAYGQTIRKEANRALAQDFCFQTNISGTLQDFLCGSGSTRGQVQLGPTVGALSSFSGHKIRGVSDATAATAGHIGEYIEAKNAASTSYGATTTYSDANNIVLTAGDWDISYLVTARNNGSTTAAIVSFVGTVSGNNSTGLLDGENSCSVPPPATAYDSGCSIAGYRQNISSTTTYYLKVRADYSAGTPQYRYKISARRIR